MQISGLYAAGLAMLMSAALIQAQDYPVLPERSDENSFSMVVLPDPQSYIKYAANQPLFELQTAWIINSMERLNTKCVLCTGDLVEQNDIQTFRTWGLDILPHREKMEKRELDKEFKNTENPLSKRNIIRPSEFFGPPAWIIYCSPWAIFKGETSSGASLPLRLSKTNIPILCI